MTLTYVCHKCGQNYSQKDLSGSNFCAACGSFLIKQYTVTDRPAQSLHKKQYPHAESEENRENKDLKRVAQNLRQRTQTTKEYQILPQPEQHENSEGGVSEGWIYESEYDQALKLKADLSRKFEGKSLEEAIQGKVVSNEHSECYCIYELHNLKFKKPSFEESREMLLSELKLLPGIGPARELTLKNQGVKTIEALVQYPKWRRSAKEFVQLVDSKDVLALQDFLRGSLPKSHPLSHYLAGFCRNEDFAIIDIETMGLFGRPIILVGVANVEKNRVCTRQFLVRDVSEEAGALWEFVSGLNDNSALITFNGRCFDVPFISERLAYYGLDSELGYPHFDVLHFARRALRGRLPNYRLETVEQYLKVKRSINIPGALVPEFYDSYQHTGNVGPLVAIVEHNKQDLVTLTQLFCSLYGEWKL